MDFRDNLYTIKELNVVAKEHNLSKTFQTYTPIYNLIRAGIVPVVKAGNRYLLKISDIEKALVKTAAPVNGIRRID